MTTFVLLTMSPNTFIHRSEFHTKIILKFKRQYSFNFLIVLQQSTVQNNNKLFFKKIELACILTSIFIISELDIQVVVAWIFKARIFNFIKSG